MDDDGIRAVHRRVQAILRREDGGEDHYYACVVVSDLSSVPFDRVWEACAEE